MHMTFCLAFANAATGASSSTAWALVPLKPKELTPAMRRLSPARATASMSVGTRLVAPPTDMGLGRLKCR